jgi:hypothetical protein
MTIEAALLGRDHTTYTAPTGGTDKAISIAASQNGQKVTATFDVETDFTTRKSIEFTVKDPVALESAPGGYTQARETVAVKWPMTLSNGNRTVNTAQISIARDPEMSDTDVSALRLMLTQILADSAFDSFWISHRLV